MMNTLMEKLKSLLDSLDDAGLWIGLLSLRLILAKEFWDAGIEKLNGTNWFIDMPEMFPFPFNLLPPEFSWHLATGFEIVGSIALVLGLGTRFFAASLTILTLVAIAAVHVGHGYTISEGGWKLPLIYLAMLLPLILSGPGKLSLDHALRQRFMRTQRRLWS
jgi:putative oxidoreductase